MLLAEEAPQWVRWSRQQAYLSTLDNSSRWTKWACFRSDPDPAEALQIGLFSPQGPTLASDLGHSAGGYASHLPHRGGRPGPERRPKVRCVPWLWDPQKLKLADAQRLSKAHGNGKGLCVALGGLFAFSKMGVLGQSADGQNAITSDFTFDFRMLGFPVFSFQIACHARLHIALR